MAVGQRRGRPGRGRGDVPFPPRHGPRTSGGERGGTRIARGGERAHVRDRERRRNDARALPQGGIRAARLQAPLREATGLVSRLRHLAKLLSFGEGLQLLQRLVLDLADPLAGDVEGPPDLVERTRVLAAEPVAELEHAPLAVGEVLERLAQRLLRQKVGGAVEWRLGLLVRDELAELRLLLVADGLLE